MENIPGFKKPLENKEPRKRINRFTSSDSLEERFGPGAYDEKPFKKNHLWENKLERGEASYYQKLETDQLDMKFYAARESLRSDILLGKKISKKDSLTYSRLRKEMDVRGISVSSSINNSVEKIDIDDAVDNLLSAIDLGDENENIEPLDQSFVDLGHQDLAFQEFEIDAREKFNRMKHYAKHKDINPEKYEIFKEDWKIAKQKVIEYEENSIANKSANRKIELVETNKKDEGEYISENVA